MLQVARQAEQHGVAGPHVHAGDVDAVGAHADPVVAPVAAEQEHVDPVAARPRVVPAYGAARLGGPARRGEHRVEGLLGHADIPGGDRERRRDDDREHARDQPGEDLPLRGSRPGRRTTYERMTSQNQATAQAANTSEIWPSQPSARPARPASAPTATHATATTPVR
ncbi:hypothetical protein GCM10027612_63780 [Microbispora bryophytorum subsp. camponoti]